MPKVRQPTQEAAQGGRRAKGVKGTLLTHQGKTSPHTAERPPWGTATGRGHAHAALDRSPRAI
jgi:hypothetical protein